MISVCQGTLEQAFALTIALFGLVALGLCDSSLVDSGSIQIHSSSSLTPESLEVAYFPSKTIFNQVIQNCSFSVIIYFCSFIKNARMLHVLIMEEREGKGGPRMINISSIVLFWTIDFSLPI